MVMLSSSVVTSQTSNTGSSTIKKNTYRLSFYSFMGMKEENNFGNVTVARPKNKQNICIQYVII